jgi:hypothetical protein
MLCYGVHPPDTFRGSRPPVGELRSLLFLPVAYAVHGVSVAGVQLSKAFDNCSLTQGAPSAPTQMALGYAVTSGGLAARPPWCP